MQTKEQLRITYSGRVFDLTEVRWGGSITSGVPDAIVRSSSSAISGSARVMLPANTTRRPSPDMFPRLEPGSKVALESLVDGEIISSILMILTHVEITEDAVNVSFSTDTLAFSNIVRVAPQVDFMPPGWDIGDGDGSATWASRLGDVNPRAPAAYVAWAAFREAGFHCVPPISGRTILNVPYQWHGGADSWHPNGGHIFATHAQSNASKTPGFIWNDGMTWATDCVTWVASAREGNRTWGQPREVAGNFLYDFTSSSAVAFLTVIFGGENWVSIEAHPNGAIVVHTSEGTGGSLPAGSVHGRKVVKFSISSKDSWWRVGVASRWIDGSFTARASKNDQGHDWFTGCRMTANPGARVAGLQVRELASRTSHYADGMTDADGHFHPKVHINVPLSMWDGRAIKSVRDVEARDLLDDLAESLCASWWVDEGGVARFWDMKALNEQAPARSYSIDRDVSAYTLTGEDVVKRDAVRINYSSVSYSRNRRPRVPLFTGRGATISPGDENEETIEPDENVDWIAPDWTISRFNKWATPPSDSKESSWWGWTVREGTGSVKQGMQRITPWRYRYYASAESDDDSYTAVAEVDGQKFPVINGRGLVEYSETSKLMGTTSADAPYVHEGGYWITTDAVAGRIGQYLLDLSKNPIPMTKLDVIYSPELRLGKVILVTAGEASWSTRKLLVTKVAHRPEELRTSLEVVEISKTDAPKNTWADAEAATRKASFTYQLAEQRTRVGGTHWAAVEQNPATYPHGV